MLIIGKVKRYKTRYSTNSVKTDVCNGLVHMWERGIGERRHTRLQKDELHNKSCWENQLAHEK